MRRQSCSPRSATIHHAVWLLPLTLPLSAPFLSAQPAPQPETGNTGPGTKAAAGPLSPADALAAFRVDPGLKVELAACEPQVIDPVAMAFDESGRMWVVEMGDYPNGPAPGVPPEGRVVVLEDRDGDGRYEHRSVFADRLLMANGLMPWRGGVIVTAAPDILFLQDTDGDGRADRREVLYTGFETGNPQLRVSSPTLGPDNWIYCANGYRGGKIRKPGAPDAPVVDIGGMDFRFDPIGGRYEADSGMGQFGLTFDDWGNRFVCTNRNHLIPIPIPDRYIRRNPFMAPPERAKDNQTASGSARIHPISRNWTTATFHAGSFTASCGVTVYRGMLLPPEYRGCVFTCDPTGNLVHQEVMTPDGASFTWKPPHEGVEFLATADDWCRPVNLANGPDGALYVVDMYRAVIEHPEFMPPELKNRPDLTLGRDRGRIWRVVPAKYERTSAKPALGKASTAELVGTLEHSGGWWRTTAQRLLLERRSPDAIPPLRRAAAKSESPLARIHAAWLLQAMGSLDADAITVLLQSDHARVREHGVRLASESWLAMAAPLRERVVALADDPDARVRCWIALFLGGFGDDTMLPALATIARRDAGDRWTRAAIVSAVPARAGALIAMLADRVGAASRRDTAGGPEDPGPGGRGLPLPTPAGLSSLLRDLASVVGARRDPAEVRGLLNTLLALEDGESPRLQTACLNGLIDGMSRRGTQLGAFLDSLPKDAAPSLREKIAPLFARAAAVAADAKVDLPERLDAMRLLAHAPSATALPVLEGLLAADPAPEVRVAAVRALDAHPGPEPAAVLAKSWSDQTPAVRREIVDALVRRPERIAVLLDEIAARRIGPGDIGPARARELVNHADAAVRDRARKLLQDSLPADRSAVLARYQAAVVRPGDVARGRKVFEKNCTTCHRVDGVGVEIGPDISDIGRTKTLDQLLLDILNPNAAVDGNFFNHAVERKDGTLVGGIVAAETASAVTLKRPGGQTDTVLREDIAEMRSTGLSLMPEGLEQSVSIEDMTDLLAFLKHRRTVEAGLPLPEREATAPASDLPLFNGKDLAGFYTWLRTKGVNNDPDRVFTVEDGALHVSGREFGYICTLQEYRDYRLTAEFKWGEKTWPPREANARDNGILFHVQGPDLVFPRSIEFQIIEGGTGDALAVSGASFAFEEAWRSRLAGALSPDGKRLVGGRLNWAGRSPDWKDALGFRGAQDLEKPHGEWNAVELVADGDTFTLTVNGTVAQRCAGAEPRKGRIAFQSEGAETFFRQIELRPLRR